MDHRADWRVQRRAIRRACGGGSGRRESLTLDAAAGDASSSSVAASARASKAGRGLARATATRLFIASADEQQGLACVGVGGGVHHQSRMLGGGEVVDGVW